MEEIIRELNNELTEAKKDEEKQFFFQTVNQFRKDEKLFPLETREWFVELLWDSYCELMKANKGMCEFSIKKVYVKCAKKYHLQEKEVENQTQQILEKIRKSTNSMFSNTTTERMIPTIVAVIVMFLPKSSSKLDP